MRILLLEDRPTGSGAGGLFSGTAGWVFRRHRFRTRRRLAMADSLALRSFLGFELSQTTPDHSTISRTRRLIDVETHRKVFLWVLGMLAEEGLLKGKPVAIDGTTLEANAALRS